MPQHNARPDIYQQVTDRIVAALEAGVAPWVCPWDRSGGQPHNGASGHVYKGVNVVLTGMSGYADARWYTYRQAQAKGGQVRRGEKGTTVIYWQFIEKEAAPKDALEAADNGDGNESAGSRKIPLLKSYTVFNHEQIEWPGGEQGEAEPVEPVASPMTAGFEAAAELVASSVANIRHGGVRAYYSPLEDRITLPEAARFTSPADYWSTALHELTHWTGHATRLDRDLSGRRFGEEAYAAEELVAELGSAFLCAELGVQGKLQHEEYLGHWIKVLRNDKRAIFTAARLAQEAAAFLNKQAGDQGEAGQAEEREAA